MIPAAGDGAEADRPATRSSSGRGPVTSWHFTLTSRSHVQRSRSSPAHADERDLVRDARGSGLATEHETA